MGCLDNHMTCQIKQFLLIDLLDSAKPQLRFSIQVSSFFSSNALELITVEVVRTGN